jgi:Aspartyl protease
MSLCSISSNTELGRWMPMKQILGSFRRLGIFGGLLLLCFRTAADSVQLQLPAEMAINRGAGRGDFLFVTVRLESGENLPFIVDTGSPCTLVDKSFAPKLGKRLRTMPVDTVRHDSQKAALYVSPKLYLGNTALVTGSNIFSYHFEQPSGLLGMDCLQSYCIQLDFQTGKIRFLDSDSLNTADFGKAYPLTLSRTGPQWKFVRPIIHHAGLVGENTNLIIDTGCRIDGLVEKSSVKGSRSEKRTLQECVWDGQSYTNISIVAVGRANVLGLSFLARHLVTLDFPKQTMYLKQKSVGSLSDETRKTPPNPQGGANGRQPFSTDTNRTLAAAASRRSP